MGIPVGAGNLTHNLLAGGSYLLCHRDAIIHSGRYVLNVLFHLK